MTGVPVSSTFIRGAVNALSTLSFTATFAHTICPEKEQAVDHPLDDPPYLYLDLDRPLSTLSPSQLACNNMRRCATRKSLCNISSGPVHSRPLSTSTRVFSSTRVEDQAHLPPESPCISKEDITESPRPPPSSEVHSNDTIHQLIRNPVLYDPIRPPRYPIVLCHGLYGFDVRGPTSIPSLRMHYWSNVLTILRDKVGAEVITTTVPGTGSVISRSHNLHKQLQDKARGRGVNFLAHSMGGLDCRHLITHLKPEEYVPLSLTTVATPHRGSPFMDWCVDNIGIGRLRATEKLLSEALSTSSMSDPNTSPPANSTLDPTSDASKALQEKSQTPFSLSLSSLPSSVTTLLLGVVDSPAYSNLTTSYLQNIFNPATPDDPNVKYFSVAARMESVSVWHPFWLPKMVLDGAEEKQREEMKRLWEEDTGANSRALERVSALDEGRRPLWALDNEWGNDGLVTVQSSKWGEFLGTMEGCDHWEIRGARGIELAADLRSVVGSLPPLGINLNSIGVPEGWGLGDWTKFVGAWNRQEKRAEEDAKGGEKLPETKAKTKEQHDKEKAEDEAFIKQSAHKLSAVFDWLIEQIPSSTILSPKGKSLATEEMKGRSREEGEVLRQEREAQLQGKKERKKNELETKEDLERFYIALSRKLYDEGL